MRNHQEKMPVQINQRFIRLPQVQLMVGFCKTMIYAKIKEGIFPRQIKLGRISGWVESEVQDWINQQIQDRDVMPHKASRRQSRD